MGVRAEARNCVLLAVLGHWAKPDVKNISSERL